MKRELSAKTIMYILISFLILAILIHIVTNNDMYIYTVILIGGCVGIFKPLILKNFYEEEFSKGKMIMEPWFSEDVYKLIGFAGGLILVLVAIARLIFDINI